MTTRESRTQMCDVCSRGGHAEKGELIPDGWAYSHAGVLHCDACVAAKKERES